MCRNVDILAADAFYSGKTKTICRNTKVENFRLFLHGHEIARLINGHLEINLCGYNTQTTRARLNALDGVNLTQKNFKLLLNGEEIPDSEWIQIN
jgi:hypothetical protein